MWGEELDIRGGYVPFGMQAVETEISILVLATSYF